MDQEQYEKFDDGSNRFTIDGFCDTQFEEYQEDGITMHSVYWGPKGPQVEGHWLLGKDLELKDLPPPEDPDDLDYANDDSKLPKFVKEISYDGVDYGPTDDPSELYSNWSDFPDLAKPEIWKHLAPRNFGSMRHAWWSNYRVTNWNSCVYILSEILETEDDKDEERIITALYDPLFDLQLGDSFSAAYLVDEKHVILRNCGDVSSVVTIKMN